jgi:hypothetical protein
MKHVKGTNTIWCDECEYIQSLLNIKLSQLKVNTTYLKSKTKPYVSMSIPNRGQPSSTTKIPPKNATDAFTLCFWKKNLKVRSSPITHAKPAMNKI